MGDIEEIVGRGATSESTRYLPRTVADIFGGPYFVTLYPDQTCAVTVWTGEHWHELRRR